MAEHKPPAAAPAAAATTTTATAAATTTTAATGPATATEARPAATPAAAAAGAAATGSRDPAALLQQLSSLADDDDSWEADASYLTYLEAKYRDVECPLFLETIPDDPSDDPQLHALQLLAYEGETPLSVFKRYKDEANKHLKEAILSIKANNTNKARQALQQAHQAYKYVRKP